MGSCRHQSGRARADLDARRDHRCWRRPWVTIVWNDPVNLMSYVTFVFQKYFGYAKSKADKLMMEVHEDGRSVVSHGQPRGDGARRAGDARVRPVGDHAEGRRQSMSGFTRHRRSGPASRPSPRFEADLLRSLAGQLIELLRNEAADRREHADPLEELLDFSGPTTEPDDPVLARLFPTAYPEDEEAAARLPPLHRGQRCATARPTRPRRSSTPSRRPGCPASSRGRPVHRRRARPGGRAGLAALVHRHAARHRHPARGRGGRRGLLGLAARRRPARPRCTTSTTGSATSRRRSSRA